MDTRILIALGVILVLAALLGGVFYRRKTVGPVPRARADADAPTMEQEWDKFTRVMEEKAVGLRGNSAAPGPALAEAVKWADQANALVRAIVERHTCQELQSPHFVAIAHQVFQVYWARVALSRTVRKGPAPAAEARPPPGDSPTVLADLLAYVRAVKGDYELGLGDVSTWNIACPEQHSVRTDVNKPSAKRFRSSASK